jgi:hypothetical protein
MKLSQEWKKIVLMSQMALQGSHKCCMVICGAMHPLSPYPALNKSTACYALPLVQISKNGL